MDADAPGIAERALVLGGGGVTGVGWELGVIAGLAEAGVRLIDADLVVGTSAGSVVAAQLTSGHALEELYEAQLAPPTSELAARLSPLSLLRFGVAMVRSRDAQQFRVRIGAMALAAKTVSEADRREVISARLPSHAWPDRRMLITAVDAETGEFVTFDRDGPVSLVDAVGASCAVPTVWPPVTIDGRRYVDGGMRSGANADLAADAARVVVIAPVATGGGYLTRASDQVAELNRHARAILIMPDEEALAAIGRNVLDPARRAPAARAGRAQAARIAAEVAAVWTA
jgi:NTE family protein